jgi:hypothetical protein
MLCTAKTTTQINPGGYGQKLLIRRCFKNNHLSIKLNNFTSLGSHSRIRLDGMDPGLRIRTQSPDAQARHEGTRPYTDLKLVVRSDTDWIITDRIRISAHNAKPRPSCSLIKGHRCIKEKIVAETIRERKDRPSP